MAELDEARLVAKLRAIEALYARPGSDGERDAARHARERILERLRAVAEADPPVEYRFSMADMWSRRVFVALLRRYEIRPYRYRGQRYTTVMAKVSKRFVDETLWPEFQALSASLRTYLDEVTNRVVAQVIHADVSEAAVMEQPAQIPLDIAPAPPATAPTGAGGQVKSAQDVAATSSTSASASSTSTSDARRQRNRRKRARRNGRKRR